MCNNISYDRLSQYLPFLAFLYDYLMQSYELLWMMMNGMNFSLFFVSVFDMMNDRIE